MTPFTSEFTTIYGYFSSVIGHVSSSYASGMLGFVVPILTASGTLYFALIGFAVMRGAIAKPIVELAWNAIKYGIVVAMLGASGLAMSLIPSINQLPAQIASYGSGQVSTNVGQTMDNYQNDAYQFDVIVNNKLDNDNQKFITTTNNNPGTQTLSTLTNDSLATAASDPGGMFMVAIEKLVGYFCIFVAHACAGLSACVGFVVILFAMIALDIVLAFTPIAVACTLWPQSRFFFQSWLSQIINYVVLFVVMSIIASIVTGVTAQVLTTGLGKASFLTDNLVANGSIGEVGTNQLIVMTIYVIIIYAIGTIFFIEAPKIASGLAGGSASGGHAFMAVGANQIMNRMGSSSGARTVTSGGGAGVNSIRKGK